MESSQLFSSLVLFLSISPLLFSHAQSILPPPGTIQRTTKQQILASIPPNSEQTTKPFLTSPSGKYAAYFLRRETTPGAGGFGNDFCYIQVQDSSTDESLWESECAPVSTVNTCALVFDDNGLEVFDGSKPEWNTDSQANDPLATLELVDDGDMRMMDDKGELAWRAADEPRANQQCGSPGSPGLAPARPPFAGPVGGERNLPFGQPVKGPAAGGGASEEIGGGIGGQPLLDSTPYYSGSLRGAEPLFGVCVALLVLLVSGMIV